MAISLRPTIPSDIPSIAILDAAANAYHPLISIPWASAADRHAVWLSRLSDFLSKKSKYYFISAVASGEVKDGGQEKDDEVAEKVVGYLIGTYPEAEWKKEDNGEWQPDFPDGTKKEVFGYYLPFVIKEQAGLLKPDMYELESLSLSNSHQRLGIGTLMINQWFKDIQIDAKHAPAFVVSSANGKGLYEKFGWKVVKTIAVPLKDFGWEEPYVNWCMVREARGKE